MKTTATKSAPRRAASARASAILAALRDARKDAVRSARMHRVPIVYLRRGTLVRERT